jgi:CHAT domain-containing protein/cytochrome c-type biogenesis protein CcmH/NrfG
VSSPNEHFSPEQFEWLVNGRESERACEAPADFWDTAGKHLEQCRSCEKLVQLHAEIEKRLNAQKARPGRVQNDDCPDGQVWLELATGILPEPRAEQLMNHALQCDHCGLLLREAVEDVGVETPLEETDAMAGLQTANSDWQRKFANRLAKESQSRQQMTHSALPRRRWLALGWALAAIAVVFAVSFWLNARDSVGKADRLIAKAYSVNRTSEFRIGHADYGRVQVRRGPAKEDPEELLEARAMLDRLRKNQENNPEFLQAQGRASLAELDISSALTALKRAHELLPDSSSILTDLAAAYAVEGDGGTPETYETALQFLDEALQKTPNDSTALFNRAIVNERLQSFDHAVQDWNAFLRVTPSGPWADEARQKSGADSEKLKKEKERGLDPSTLLKWLQTSPSTEALEARSEDLADAAASNWIANPQPIISELSLVARINRDWNHDPWLSELLEHSRENGFSSAASHLSAAVRANNSGDHGTALANARQAVTEFGAIGNLAGATRARWEAAYALQRSAEARACIHESHDVANKARAHQYGWIEIQSVMVEGVCVGMLGDDQSAAKSFNTALSLARSHNYSSLELRALIMQSSAEGSEGQTSKEWSTDLDGLSRYWAGSSPPLRAYQLYSDMTSLAEKAALWNVAKSFGEEAVHAAQQSPYRYAEAIAELRLGEALKNCSELDSSATHLAAAAQLFSELPPSDATNLYRIDAEVQLSSLEIDGPSTSVASLSRLAALEPVVKTVDQGRIVLRYYNSLGKLNLSAGKVAEARSAFENSIAITRRERGSFVSPASRASLAQDAVAAYRNLASTLLLQSQTDQALAVWEDFEGSEWIDSRARNISDRTWPPSVTVSNDIHSVLPLLTDETFVTFMRASDGLNIWVFDSRGIQFRHVEVSSSWLDAVVAHFTQICSTPDSSLDDVSRSAREIYSWYIAPIESYLSEAKTIVIEPDPMDSDLPFSALQNPHGRYLGLSFNLVQSTGVEEWIHLRHVAPVSATDSALLVANPSLANQSSEEFAPLPEAVNEAQSISVMFRNARLLLGRDANLPAVNANISNISVFHFAGHTLSTARQNGLLLSDSAGNPTEGPRILDATSFPIGSFAKSKLFVLAACSSGKHSGQNSVSRRSIAHSFQLAGVPSVVATSWDVESRATTDYTVRFYQELLRGRPVAAALRAAAQATASSPSTSHPYYWASFVVYGRS